MKTGYSNLLGEYMMKVFSEISHEMTGCLIRLPYFDLLRESKS